MGGKVVKRESKLTVAAGTQHIVIGDKIRIGDEGIFEVTGVEHSLSEITVTGRMALAQPVNFVEVDIVTFDENVGDGWEGVDRGVDGKKFLEAKKKPNNLTRPEGEWKVSA